jgi:FkbM family methyltransferase
MFIKKLKSRVKASPFFYKLLFPVVARFRRTRWQVKNRARTKAINRFRKYCLNLSQVVSKPFFVKVGANDGISGDPCSDIFLANTNWHGLLIEPVPHCFKVLKTNFPDTQRFSFEQVAVGSPEGEASFYYIDPKARDKMPNWQDWFDELGSFNRNHIIKHLNGVLEPYIVEGKVPVVPLSEILKRNGIQKTHLLHIDAEGYDYEVLKTLDLSKNAPLAIFIEHFHLSDSDRQEMLQLLHKQGYRVLDCLSDYFAVHEEQDKQLTAQMKRR